MALAFLARHEREGRGAGFTTASFALSSAAPRPGHGGAPKRVDLERETDERRLTQRQKQIDIGKQCEAYKKYARLVPK